MNIICDGKIFTFLMYVMAIGSIFALKLYDMHWPVVAFLIIALFVECISLFMNIRKYKKSRNRKLVYPIISELLLIIMIASGLVKYKILLNAIQKFISRMN